MMTEEELSIMLEEEMRKQYEKYLTWSVRSSKESKKNINMEEIKLPKFKTKEELEQFAMGLMTENESLKAIIKYKDDSIKQLRKNVLDSLHLDIVISTQKDTIKRLESEVQSLREKTSKDKYKELYDKEHREHIATKITNVNSQFELSKTKRMVHKLSSMVTFMFGLLPRFKAKRVYDTYGEFDAAEYRV